MDRPASRVSTNDLHDGPLHPMTWYAGFVRDRAWLVASLVAVATAFAVVGLGRVDFDEEPRNFVHHDARDKALLDELFRDFGADDTDVLAAVEGLSPRDPETVRVVLGLIERLRDEDEVLSVSSPFDARRVGRPLVPLFPRTPEHFTPERLAGAFAAARAHPALVGQLVSRDGSVFLIAIRLRETSGGIAETRRQVERLRTMVADATHGTPISVTLAGHPPLRVDVIDAVRREFYRSILFAGVMTLGVAVVAFRSLQGVTTALAGPTIGLVWTLGWMGWTGQRINGLNTILPSLVFVLAFSDSTHLIVAYRAARALGLGPPDAVSRALLDVGSACVLMVLTTAVGFGALGVAQIPGVRQFGIAGAVGTILGLVAVLTVMPTLAILGFRGRDGVAHAEPGAAGSRDAAGPDATGPTLLLQRWALSCLARPWLCVWVSVAVTAGLLVVALRLESDVRWLEMLPPGSPTIVVTTRCDEKLGGSLLASVIVEWPEPLSLESPEVLDVLARVGDELEASPVLANAFSVRQLLAALATDGDTDATAFRRLRRVPDGQLHRLVRESLRRAVVTAHVPDIGAARLLPEFDEVTRRLAALEADHPGFRIRLTGSAVTAARAVYQIIEDTRTSLFTSAVIILLMTVIAFRSLRYGLLCVLPNLFPLLATAAALVLVGEPLRLASAVTFSIALGLADDSAIHFVSAFLRGRRDGLSTREAVGSVLSTSGRAMVIAALTLVAGMTPLLVCQLPPLRTFAALSIFAILAALVADFFILPSVLVCFAGPVERPADGDPPGSPADRDRPVTSAG